MKSACSRRESHNYSSLLWGNAFGAFFNTAGTLILLTTSIVLHLALSTANITSGEFLSLL